MVEVAKGTAAAGAVMWSGIGNEQDISGVLSPWCLLCSLWSY
jgi:hypothetical protein